MVLVVLLLDHNGSLSSDSFHLSEENEVEDSHNDSWSVTFLCLLPISYEGTMARRKSRHAHWGIVLVSFFLGNMLYPSNSDN